MNDTDKTGAGIPSNVLERSRERYGSHLRKLSRYNDFGPGILADWQIEERTRLPVGHPFRLEIEPFSPPVKVAGTVSFGLSSYGYDLRLGRKFRVFQNPPPVVNPMSHVQAAWVAGLIDGEGCLHYSTKETSAGIRYPRISVGMTCLKTLTMLKNITGAGGVCSKNGGKPRISGHLPQWAWAVGKTRAVLQILLQIMPYMTTKRQQAEEMLSRSYGKAGCATVVDPKTITDEMLTPHEGDSCIIPPNAFILAESLETFRIPEDVLCIVMGKSTYARVGINLPMTPLEPGWRGVVTIEIANSTPLPARVHAGEGIGQVLFLEGSAPCRLPYNRKANPSYQDQTGLVLSKV